MKITGAVLVLLALTLMLLACAQQGKQAQTPSSALPKGTLQVTKLPASVEGLELKNGLLMLKPGYKFIKQPRHRFAVARASGGRHVTSGGCGCTGGTCDPTSQGSIIVCQATNCTGSCGLALTIAGVSTTIMRY